jgi:biotin carboxyl carrier protein
MDFDEITKILDMMREHELSEFELERENFKIRLRKHGGGHWVSAAPPPQMPAAPSTPGASPDGGAAGAGTPVPGAPPYAEVGDTVKKGQVLCIIEAMKLMNEINAEIGGEVVKVYVENGHAVQYGERLFAIKPA